MSVSTISVVGQEGFVDGTSTFIRSGVLYVVSSVVATAGGQRRLQWKPHTSGNFTEIFSPLAGNLQRFVVIHDPTTDRLLVVWDEDAPAGEDGAIYSALLSPTTGAIIVDKTEVAPKGRSPSVAYTGGVLGNDFTLAYLVRTTGYSYVRQTLDGGVTWGSQQPILTGKVSKAVSVSVISYDETHVTLAQVGTNARPLEEVSAFQRTRPLGALIKHPTLSNHVYVAESSWNSIHVDPEDNLRGGLALSRDNLDIWSINNDRRGVSDSINTLSLFTVTGGALSLVSSNGAGGLSSLYVERRSVGASVPATSYSGTGTNTPGAITDIAVGKDLVFTVSHMDTLTGGFFCRINPTLPPPDVNTIGPLEGHFGISIDTLNPVNNGVIVVGRRDFALSAFFVDVYDENGTAAPIFRSSHRMPAKINAVKLVLSSATAGTLYVGMEDRLNIYRIDGLTNPIRLLSSFPVITRGRFHQIQTTPAGYIVAAMGAGGVALFNPEGRMVGQVNPSNIGGVTKWRNNSAYVSGQYVMATDKNPLSQRNHYFKCTTGGTSSLYEPIWPTSGTVTDGTVTWTFQGSTVASVCGVVVDAPEKRIFAVGNVDGDTGVNGKLWLFKTREAI